MITVSGTWAFEGIDVRCAEASPSLRRDSRGHAGGVGEHGVAHSI